MAGEAVKENFVHLINIGLGRQECTLKTATSHMLSVSKHYKLQQ